MQCNILLNADPAIRHWIEFVAGTSNEIILSQAESVLAKAMLQEAELKDESLEMESHMERLRVALAPHKIVPAEILVIIFQYTSTSEEFYHSCSVLTDYEPLIFSRVCSRWRTIARSEPSFWNYAVFSGGRDWNYKLALVKFWMDNFVVDPYPLSFTLYLFKNEHCDSELLQFILSQHERIRGLTIFVMERFLRMPIHSFPLLEDLTIFVTNPDLLLFERSPCLAGMENLRTFTIHLDCPIQEIMFTWVTLPWGRLTSLLIAFPNIRSDYFTMPQAVELLKQCASLQKCFISVQNTSAPSPNFTLHLPHLTDLKFRAYQYDLDDKFSLMHFLITPVLKSLTIIVPLTYDGYVNLAKPDIGPIVRRSGCSLNTLDMTNDLSLSTDADLDFELLSCLHTLKVESTIFSNETIDKMMQGILLPNIQILTVAIDHIDTLEHLTKLVETRSSSPPDVPRLIFLDVMIVGGREDAKLEYSDIETCSKRIKACGTKFFKDGSRLHHGHLL